MSFFSPLEVFEVFQGVASRICSDADIAHDLAMQEFEKFFAVKKRSNPNVNLRAYAWKVIGCKYRQHLRDQWAHVSERRFDEDAEDRMHALFPPTRATQEDYVHARQWLPFIDELPEPCKSAIEILAGGGGVADVMLELKMSPKSALYAINEGRRLLKKRVDT